MRSRGKSSERNGLRAVISALPRIDQGLTQVLYTGDKPVFQLLVASELEKGGRCLWIDSENHSSTYKLAEAGGRQKLERVDIGRSFTPFQHHQLCQRIEKYIDNSTEIIALPAVNATYEDGQIGKEEAEELLKDSLREVRKVAVDRGLKVVISNSSKVEGRLEYLTGVFSDRNLSVKETVHGIKFRSGDFRTMAYPGSGSIQTTIPLWGEAGGDKAGKNKLDLQATSE